MNKIHLFKSDYCFCYHKTWVFGKKNEFLHPVYTNFYLVNQENYNAP